MQTANQLNGQSHPNEEMTNSKINKALKILESIDNDDLETIQDKMIHKYDQVRESLSDTAQNVSTNVRARARLVNRNAHHEPWKFVGAATILGVAAGFLLGARRK